MIRMKNDRGTLTLWCCLCAIAAVIIAAGCRTRMKKETLATVNGEEISAQEFMEFYNSRPRVADWTSQGGTLDPESVLDALVEKILMEQEARKMGLASSTVLAEQAEKFKQRVMVNVFIQKRFDPQVHITDQEVLESIPAYQKREVKFARISVLDEDEAWDIKRRLDEGDDFSQLARSRSIGIEAPQGGVGDFLSPHRGIYPKQVIETIFTLPIGAVSDPQKVREGYALFKPLEERPLNQAELEQVVQYHRSLLFRDKKNKLIRDLLEEAKRERGISIHREALERVASGEESSSPASSNLALAEGDGIIITWGDIRGIIPQSPGQGAKAFWEDPNLLASMVETRLNKQLMVLEAEKAGFSDDPDLAKEVRRFEQDLLARQLMMYEVERKIVVTDEDCRKYYQENLIRFSEPEMVRASHILVKDKEKADEILSKLKDGEDFATLAEAYSEYSITSRKGGDMGYIKSGQSGMGREFEQVAFSLPIGAISELVNTPFGYQIITVTEKQPSRAVPFEEVRDSIRKDLVNQMRKSLFDSYLQDLRKKATIAVNQKLFQTIKHDLTKTGPGGHDQG
ncbi:MAG: peptidyl-prolyl cis-trans isomerase [bacterium]